jgi:ABC-type phosphate transport system ATPase subunit
MLSLGECVEQGPTPQVFKSPVDTRTADYVLGRFG